jgi:signal transduction histidine kinase
MTVRPWAPIAAAALAGCLVTVLVTVLPTVEFAYRSPRTHVAIETAAALIALITACLLYGRVRTRRRTGDLALLAALTLLAATNLCFSTIPAITDAEEERFFIWAAIAGRTLAAAGFAAAAFLPDRALRAIRGAVGRTLAASLALVALCALFGWLASDVPTGVDPNLSPESAARPRVVGAPGLLGALLATMALYGAAAIGFGRRAIRDRDSLMTWFAAGAAIAAFARVNYFLFPSIFSSYVFTGDGLRLAFYLLLLAGVLREIGVYQREAARGAVLEDRRRMARDLHDGLAQELAFLSLETRRLAEEGGDPRFERLATAADRALDESRSAIDALARAAPEPLANALAGLADTISNRSGVQVRVHVDGAPELGEMEADQLLKVVREAMTNAVQHGEGTSVEVVLRVDDGLRVTVSDDGCGFDAAEVSRRSGPRGFGLASMRERAAHMGATLEVRSAPGRGTEVEIALPWSQRPKS